MSTRVDFYSAWMHIMRGWGFPVLEASGWQSRDAEPNTSYHPEDGAYLEHHDASTPLSGNWGALAYIIANKLANIVTARDGQVMLCAAGVEWHAGVGSYPGIPTNGMNPLSLGNEVCNSGSEAYDPRCTRTIIASEAAWCIVAERGPDWVLGHKEWGNRPPGGWPGRKTDPSLNMDDRRRQVAAWLANPQEDDVLQDSDKAKLQGWVREAVGLAPIESTPGGIGGGKPRTLQAMLGRGLDDANGANQKAASILALLQKGLDVTLDDADIQGIITGLAEQIPAAIGKMSDDDVARIAKAAADENDRRDRERLES